MLPWIGGAVVGAWFVLRGKPKTRCVKRDCIGSRTGKAYKVEEFPEAGLVMVKARDCRAVLERTPQGFYVRRAEGTEAGRAMLAQDFQMPELPSEEESHGP